MNKDSDSSDDEPVPGSDLCSLFESRLYNFYMKDAMYAAYILDPANFVTQNNLGTYQLAWKTLSGDHIVRFTDEVEVGWNGCSGSGYGQSDPRVLLSRAKLDRINASKCIAAMCAVSSEVASVRALRHSRDLQQPPLLCTIAVNF